MRHGKKPVRTGKAKGLPWEDLKLLSCLALFEGKESKMSLPIRDAAHYRKCLVFRVGMKSTSQVL